MCLPFCMKQNIYNMTLRMLCLLTQGIDILHDDIARIHIGGFLSFAAYMNHYQRIVLFNKQHTLFLSFMDIDIDKYIYR